MENKQKFTPKYWVVHDTRANDVFVDTLHKTKETSIDFFFATDESGTCLAGDMYMDEHPKQDGYWLADVRDWFDNHKTLTCSLIEIKLV